MLRWTFKRCQKCQYCGRIKCMVYTEIVFKTDTHKSKIKQTQKLSNNSCTNENILEASVRVNEGIIIISYCRRANLEWKEVIIDPQKQKDVKIGMNTNRKIRLQSPLPQPFPQLCLWRSLFGQELVFSLAFPADQGTGFLSSAKSDITHSPIFIL